MIESRNTYFESRESKIADFNLEILVDKNILALNITMHNSKSMHIIVYYRCLQGYINSSL